jgi:enamine deaminase RidA (YjgF/YER057c/UK114 family)
MPNIEKFCASGVYDPPTYSQGIKVTGADSILFLSGQVAYEKDGSVASRGDFKGQARGAFEAIKTLVESQGGTMANVIKITTFVTDMAYRVDLAPIREQYLGKKGPASTLVEIGSLAHPDWLIEIEAIAII